MDELTGGRGVIFATGTPVSNSMTELYTMQRYLQYGTLEKMGLIHFDAWASTFGETVTAIELAPEGTGYRARTRFAKFFNLPELMAMFKEVADIKTADQLHLPVPNAHYETMAVKPSVYQGGGWWRRCPSVLRRFIRARLTRRRTTCSGLRRMDESWGWISG